MFFVVLSKQVGHSDPGLGVYTMEHPGTNMTLLWVVAWCSKVANLAQAVEVPPPNDATGVHRATVIPYSLFSKEVIQQTDVLKRNNTNPE